MSDPRDDIRTFFDSNYITAFDLLGRDCVVTIDKIEGGEVVGEGGKKARKPIMYFKGKKKPLALNKTNMKSIKAMYGTYDRKVLAGKRITLFPTTCQRSGETVECVRIRPMIPKGAEDSVQGLNEPIPTLSDAARAVIPNETKPTREREPGDDDE